MQWNNPPSFDESKDTFVKFGTCKARIKVLEEYIENESIPIKKDNPRKPVLVRERFLSEYRELAELYAEKEQLEQQIAFLQFWKELYKANGYNNR